MRQKKYSEEAIRAALAEYFENMTIEVKTIDSIYNKMHVIFDEPIAMRYNCITKDKEIDHIVDCIKNREGRK